MPGKHLHENLVESWIYQQVVGDDTAAFYDTCILCAAFKTSSNCSYKAPLISHLKFTELVETE